MVSRILNLYSSVCNNYLSRPTLFSLQIHNGYPQNNKNDNTFPGNEAYMGLLCAIAANFVMTYGDSKYSAVIFANLSFAWPDFQMGTLFGEHAMEFSRRFPNPSMQARLEYAYHCGSYNWNHSLYTAIPIYERLFLELLQSGNIPFASYDSHIILAHRLVCQYISFSYYQKSSTRKD